MGPHPQDHSTWPHPADHKASELGTIQNLELQQRDSSLLWAGLSTEPRSPDIAGGFFTQWASVSPDREPRRGWKWGRGDTGRGPPPSLASASQLTQGLLRRHGQRRAWGSGVRGCSRDSHMLRHTRPDFVHCVFYLWPYLWKHYSRTSWTHKNKSLKISFGRHTHTKEKIFLFLL